MTDAPYIRITADIPLEFFKLYGAAVITITPNRPDPEPEALPPNPAEPQGEVGT